MRKATFRLLMLALPIILRQTDKNIPTLGTNYSHPGNKTFPAWEYPASRNLAGNEP